MIESFDPISLGLSLRPRSQSFFGLLPPHASLVTPLMNWVAFPLIWSNRVICFLRVLLQNGTWDFCEEASLLIHWIHLQVQDNRFQSPYWRVLMSLVPFALQNLFGMNTVVILTLVFKSLQCVYVLAGFQVFWPAAPSAYGLHSTPTSFNWLLHIHF